MEKITKAQAMKKMAKGEDVYMLPSKAVPGSIWIAPMLMSHEEEFDKQVNAYAYYNCNREVGMKVTYWAEG